MKKIIMAATTLLIGIILTACSYKLKTDPNELVIATSTDPVNLDIQKTNDIPTFRVSLQIYETLVILDNDLKIQPVLAKSWEKLENNIWEFKLKENVKFHNDEPFTAKDVEWTIKRALKNAAVAHLVTEVDEDNIQVVDDLTIRIKTKDTFMSLLRHLAHPAIGIMNEKAVSDAGDNYGSKVVIGTGPYKFKEWIKDKHVKLERNETYHDVKGKMEKITFKTMKEATTRLIEVEKGNIDIAYDIPPADIKKVDKNKNLDLFNSENLGVEYLGFNFKNHYLKIKEVRQAINSLIDVDSIIKNIYFGVGSRLTGPLGSQVSGFNDELKAYSYDLEKAKAYMRAAESKDSTNKIKNGEGNFTLKLYVGSNSEERVKVAQVVKEQLRNIKIEVEINKVSWATLINDVGIGNHDMTLLGWTAATADAHWGLYPLFHSSAHGSAGNMTFYTNNELDQLLDSAKKEEDLTIRNTKYKQAQKIIHEELPWVFLQTRQNITGASKQVKNFIQHPLGIYFLAKVDKKQVK